MREFRKVLSARGKEVEGFMMLVEQHGKTQKTLIFSKDKRPELWAEYEASLAPKPEADKIEDKPKKAKKKKKD